MISEILLKRKYTKILKYLEKNRKQPEFKTWLINHTKLYDDPIIRGKRFEIKAKNCYFMFANKLYFVDKKIKNYYIEVKNEPILTIIYLDYLSEM